ncbi:type II toxin-antitoxin system Phd/YefM family antitoxin [Microbacterium sp.]|uniref:type II toxin-antitoxin system Phd/YefM family antitoxin n=1 Tax=Microbacterium sp. TaxID=51671 RepID=UPI003A921E8A
MTYLVDQRWSGGYPDRMKTVKVQYAKTHLSSLLHDVEAGEEVMIARGDRPVARLVPLQTSDQRELGFVPYDVPDSFFDALPDDELSAWES